MKNQNNYVIGVATIQADVSTGTITITNAENLDCYGRSGTLTFQANGKNTTNTNNWTITKGGLVD